MEQETDLQESLTPDVDVDTSGDAQPEQPEYTTTERHLYARVKKLEAELKAKPKAEQPLQESPKPIETDKLIESIAVFRDLKDNEIAELKSEATSLGVDVLKYAKSKAGQAHLKEIRGSQEIEETTPAPSRRSPALATREADEVFKNPDADPQAKQAAWEQLMKGVRK